MELSSQDQEKLLNLAIEFVQHRYRETGCDPILDDAPTDRAMRRVLEEALPLERQDLESVWREFQTKIVAHSPKVGHPRKLAYIRTSPTFDSVVAEMLAASLNQSPTAYDAAPAATECELVVVDWIKQMSGYAPSAGGILLPGGTQANFVCQAAAIAEADPDVRESGLAGKPPFRVYLTREAHYCHAKNFGLLGVGRRNLRYVETDDQGRMSAKSLERLMAEDRKQGYLPLCAITTLGTTNTGQCDDFAAIDEVCKRYGVWHHVDGCYGGFAYLVPEKRHLTRGVEYADSFALDPQKHYFPFDAACALVKQNEHLQAAFTTQADYLPNTLQHADAPLHLRDYGPQLARRFNGLKIWMSLKLHGARRFAEAIARECQLADAMAALLRTDEEFQLMSEPVLGIVVFRCIPREAAGDIAAAEEVDRLNEAVTAEVRRRGRVFLGGTRIHGRSAARACFVSFRTQQEDLRIILDEYRAVGRMLAEQRG